MADRSRSQAWLRDELILALDLYLREGSSASPSSRQKVSDLLRSIPIEAELTADPKFRSRQAVAYKLHNFVAIDPSKATAGFPHGAHGDTEVWTEFAADPQRLAEAATAIRANIASLTPAQAEAEEPDVADAPEGALLTRVHRVRERSAKLVAKKKAQAMQAHGKLACEACAFNFEGTYGDRGVGFMECHHTVPLRALMPGSRTRLDQLALVCSNCHRMIHRRSPWLSMAELHSLAASAQQLSASAPDR
jgi:5-methylcytosine-specific restriction protein A